MHRQEITSFVRLIPENTPKYTKNTPMNRKIANNFPINSEIPYSCQPTNPGIPYYFHHRQPPPTTNPNHRIPYYQPPTNPGISYSNNSYSTTTNLIIQPTNPGIPYYHQPTTTIPNPRIPYYQPTTTNPNPRIPYYQPTNPRIPYCQPTNPRIPYCQPITPTTTIPTATTLFSANLVKPVEPDRDYIILNSKPKKECSFHCMYCPKKYTRKTSLNYHYSVKHADLSNKKVFFL